MDSAKAVGLAVFAVLFFGALLWLNPFSLLIPQTAAAAPRNCSKFQLGNPNACTVTPTPTPTYTPTPAPTYAPTPTSTAGVLLWRSRAPMPTARNALGAATAP